LAEISLLLLCILYEIPPCIIEIEHFLRQI
jgi:hypothetical protein